MERLSIRCCPLTDLHVNENQGPQLDDERRTLKIASNMDNTCTERWAKRSSSSGHQCSSIYMHEAGKKRVKGEGG